MKRLDVISICLLAVGLAVLVVGGGLTSSWPDVHEAVRTFGLWLMLAGAAVFLAAKRLARVLPANVPPWSAPRGAEESARNLATVGAVFLVGGLAVRAGLRAFLTPESWGYWILVGLAALGGLAFAVGIAGYGLAVLLRTKTTSSDRGTSP